ncbi:MAG: hypothetical protein FJ245_02920 [Nitrospira sp.]|nr:hypothetical protein [Nitrospira sp.]
MSVTVATLAAAPQDGRALRLTTSDGKVVEGTILDGTLTITNAFGSRQIDATSLRSMSPAGLMLDTGLTVTGRVSIVAGTLRVETKQGLVTIAGPALSTVQGTGSYLPPSSPGSMPGKIQGDPRTLLLGTWQDSNGQTWEFLQDGTVLMGQMTARYRLPDERHLEVDVNLGIGIMVPGSPAVLSGQGQGIGRLYELVSLDRQHMTWHLQGNEITLTRIRQ